MQDRKTTDDQLTIPDRNPGPEPQEGKKEENKISAEFDMRGAGTLIEIVISILHFCSWALPMFHAQSIIANCVFKTLAKFPPSPRTGLPAHTPQQ